MYLLLMSVTRNMLKDINYLLLHIVSCYRIHSQPEALSRYAQGALMLQTRDCTVKYRTMTWTYFEIFRTYSALIHTVQALRFSPAEKDFLDQQFILFSPR